MNKLSNKASKPLPSLTRIVHWLFVIVFVACATGAILYLMSEDEPIVIPPPVQSHAENIPSDAATGTMDKTDVLPRVEFAPGIPFANHHNSRPFEIVNCPPMPEKNYPKPYNMLKIIDNWNPDNTEIPAQHFDSLCHFDYSNATELSYAFNYRNAEVPYVVYNVPEVDEVVHKWSDPNYLRKLLGHSRYRTETSSNNHFMYWNTGSKKFLKTAEGKLWKAPTGVTQTTFNQWLDFAIANQNKTMEDRDHQYFRVTSQSPGEMMFKELPFFKPKKSLFIVDPSGQRGIHCRFGMRSVIAEAHFDGGRNMIALFGGMRRYMLTHPDQCVNMHMLPKLHPSGRHSDVDWSKPDITKYPNFAKVQGNEVIMRPGNVLYLPQDWIHYIISLNVNYQCNTRSGFAGNYRRYINECGF